MRPFLRRVALAAAVLSSSSALAQSSYRNLDAGAPVRVEDASVTEHYSLDLDLLNLRYDELSDLRTRFQYEPRVSYGAFPRTEIWMRLPIFYRERTATPRGGVAGFGVGAMYQFTIETQHLPAFALATELFAPSGPNALPASYSLKALLTRSFAPGRIHLNASIARYAIRVGPSLVITCPDPPVPGLSCGGGSVPLPPIDGPCSIGSASLKATLFCGAPQDQSLATSEQPLPGEAQHHNHWLLGVGMDKALPISSTLLLGDVFAEKFESIGRKTDVTAEFGARHQMAPRVVIAGGLGRHFRGSGFSTFLTFGMTIAYALQH